MTEEQAQARYDHQLQQYKLRVEVERTALAKAEERLAAYVREKDSYIIWYRNLP